MPLCSNCSKSFLIALRHMIAGEARALSQIHYFGKRLNSQVFFWSKLLLTQKPHIREKNQTHNFASIMKLWVATFHCGVIQCLEFKPLKVNQEFTKCSIKKSTVAHCKVLVLRATSTEKNFNPPTATVNYLISISPSHTQKQPMFTQCVPTRLSVLV